MSNTITERSHLDISPDAERSKRGQTANVGNKEENADLVDFDGSDDQLNPLNWSHAYKWSIVWLLSSMTLIVNFATVLAIPAAPQILAESSSTNLYYTILLVTIWELGEAVGPLLTAPLSEIYGRMPIYNAANILFVIASIGGGFSKNLDMLVAFRFLNGMAVASIVLNPGIVGDMFVQEERGNALSWMGLPPLLGTALGPVVGGFLTEARGWRWAFWLSTILSGSCEVFFLLLFREPYKVVILRRKAARLRKESGNEQLRCAYDGKEVSQAALLKRAVVRPAQMLLQSNILLLLAIYGAMIYGYLYLVSTTLTGIFEIRYGFSQSSAGLAYLGLGVGMIGGVLFCRLTLDRYLKKMSALNGGEMKPEYRLPPMILGSLLMPGGFLLYGWSAEAGVHWIVPILGTAFIGFGLLVTTLPLSAYLVDAFKVHAASGMAAVVILRCIAGTVLPLAGAPLYANLGLGWGNSVLGFVALCFVPVPLLFMKYGERIRTSSKYKVVS